MATAQGRVFRALMGEFNTIAGYEVLSTLGYGARSVIFKVRGPDQCLYALKRVTKSSPSDQRYLDQAIQEHHVASLFNHPALRRSYKLIKSRSFMRTSGVIVIMELVEGKTLDQGQPGNIGRLIALLRHVAEGLAVMHEAGYVHADVKPNNIMLTREGKVKLIDFGHSCPVGTVKDRIQGTPDYIAPEQVRRQAITVRTDVFNFGATMYWLLTGRHVPTSMPRKGQVGQRMQVDEPCVPPAELNDQVPPALSTLVMDCIERGPDRRPETMGQVISRLEVAASQVPPAASPNPGEPGDQDDDAGTHDLADRPDHQPPGGNQPSSDDIHASSLKHRHGTG